MRGKSTPRLLPAVMICLAVVLAIASPPVTAAEATKEDYEKRLARYDLGDKPEDHKKIASWCKRSYPSQYEYHLTEYNRHLFTLEVAKAGNPPSPRELKELAAKAEKLGLPDDASDYRGRWGETQFAAYSRKLEPGNLKMMNQLLQWSVDQRVDQIEGAYNLAVALVRDEPDNALAHGVLGHIRIDGEWTTKEDMIAGIDIKDVQARIKLHESFAASRAERDAEKKYPIDPFKGMEKVKHYYAFSPRKSPNARFFIMQNGYKRTRPNRLIISLHGGGSGGIEKATSHADTGMRTWVLVKEDFVVLAPLATKHVTDSWGTLSNVWEILDAMEEVCERFNIDRKRIYVTGQSMGGGGTTLWYLCFPELTAASCGRAGWFHHQQKQPDCLGKPIMIIQGEKDEKFRVDSKHDFLKTATKCNAEVTNISYPDVDHFIQYDKTFEKFLPFFKEEVNDIEPDFDVIRAAAQAWLK